MSDKDQKNGPSSKNVEDQGLWQQATSDVKPLPGKSVDASEEEQGGGAGKKYDKSSARVTYTNEPDKAKAKKTKEPGVGIDKRTDERLRRGKMDIDARLDLHGLNQDEARVALTDFIIGAHESGKRCVLVITGKGKGKSQGEEEEWFMPQKGVLKQQVPEWLAGDTLRPLIVQTHQAQRHHGGDGALYVLLRRHRS